MSNLSPSSLEKILEEQNPLGLKLRRTPSLLELIQTKLAQRNCAASSENNNPSTVIVADEGTGRGKNDKPKASNFQASLLRIGSWEYKSIYEGDLLAKCYFVNRKLVWEFIEGDLKSKIEMEWSDIIGFNAKFFNDDSATLTIVLARKPSFFRETNPQPRKHTNWDQTTDFTDDQASTYRQHTLQCPPGALRKHYKKIIECDLRLRILSQKKLVVDSPYFVATSTINEGKEINNRNECMVSEQMMANSGSFLTSSKCHDDLKLQNISQILLNEDSMEVDDECVLMKKVNSFTNLLGPDPHHRVDQVEVEVPAQNVYNHDHLFNDYDSITYDRDENMMMQQLQAHGGGVVNFEEDYGRMHAPASLPRKDSFSDLLLHLPRIASLPKIFDDVNENAEANDDVNNIIIIDD